MDNPTSYAPSTFTSGLHDKKPAITFQNNAWESLAEKSLPATSYSYVHGSAGTRETDERNLSAFKKWAILPTRLTGTQYPPNMKTTLFGDEYDYPLALAPVGVQTIFHPRGEKAAAGAAREVGVPYIVSTAASTSLEDIAAVSDQKLEVEGAPKPQPRWYQLYWPDNKHKHITASLLSRAKKAGYKVLVVTLDTDILGWRPSDLDNGYNPFIRNDSIGVEMGFSDPVFQRHFREKFGVGIEEDTEKAAAEWAHIIFPGSNHSWDDVKHLQELWEGPIVLKGIQTVSDAKKAVEIGVQGIVVSNHGGRQVDGGIGSLDVLPEIVDAVGDKLEVVFDSGIRCGADVAKALALGAKMVLLGRPFVYGLSVGGQDGVKHVVKSILADFSLTLHLSGIGDVSRESLNREVLRRVE
ncbi:FMN-dependent dehydrogenase [Aspergillus karnatakaensis]|uniref:FMN-dependent dehydrogenase n=1 Tax=Aspergillus karnatakaensis TaxID=1810916 RepID=UPI003CCE0F6A